MSEVFPRDIALQFGGSVLERQGVFAIPGPDRTASGQLVETVTRASVGYYLDRDRVIRKAANNKLRPHYPGGLLGADGNPLPAPLVEWTRTNAWATNTENYNHADWGKSGATVTSNTTTAPDGTAAAADKIVESALNELHFIHRTVAGMTDNLRTSVWWLVKAAERTWCRILTIDKAGTNRSTFFDLGTGLVGTKDGGHVAWIVPLTSGWYFIAVSFDAASGATTPRADLRLATGDNIGAYAGDGASGIYVWESGVEVNNAFPSVPGSILPNGLVRSSDEVLIPCQVDMASDWSLFLWLMSEHANVASWPDTSPQTDPVIIGLYPVNPAADVDNNGAMILHRQNGQAQYEWEYLQNRATVTRTLTVAHATNKLVMRHHASDHHLSLQLDNSAFGVGAAPSTVSVPAAQILFRLRPEASAAMIYGVLARGLFTQAEFEALPGAK